MPRYKNGDPVFALSPTINLLLIRYSGSDTIKVLRPSSFLSALNRSITKESSSLNSTPHSPAISLIGSPNYVEGNCINENCIVSNIDF